MYEFPALDDFLDTMEIAASRPAEQLFKDLESVQARWEVHNGVGCLFFERFYLCVIVDGAFLLGCVCDDSENPDDATARLLATDRQQFIAMPEMEE